MAAAMLLVVGCGSSGSTANKADVEAVVANISQGGTTTRAQATCIANAAVPKLSPTALKAAKKKEGDLSKIPKADQTVVFDSFSKCVTVAQLSPAIAKEFESGAGKIASKDDACYEKALTAHYKSSGDLMRAVLNDPTKFAGTLTRACPARPSRSPWSMP